ncbi:MAG TPA: hypothetical protein VKA86_03215 [Candidatus Krumholzibacteria bacterium]|nr:hypothetical protein [Candidatus Krumholzibacteria bacterium]
MELRSALAAVALIATVAHAQPPVVDNPSTPPAGRTARDATELWRVGGYDEDFLFGIVGSAAVAGDGTTYLLDEQLSEITAIDPDGRVVATFGRAGEGPGEMDQGRGIMMLPGGRVGVLNMRPPKLITYDAAGTPAGDVSLVGNEGFHFAIAATAAGDRVVVQTASTTIRETTQVSENALRAVDPATGEFVVDYLIHSEERDRLGSGGDVVITIGSPDFVGDWALAADGTLYAVRDPDDYAIEVRDARGEHVRTIRRAFERVPRQEEDVERDMAQRRAMAERTGGSFDPDTVDTLEPAIVDVFARPDGELWVLPGEGLAIEDPEVVGVFDVFDRQGRFVRQVELRAPYDRATDRMTLQGDALVVFEDLVGARGGGMMIMGDAVEQEEDDEEADPLAIARYRI